MALVYRKNSVFVLSQCSSCGRGIFNISNFLCVKCQKKSCFKCGRNFININYHNIYDCVPYTWKNIYSDNYYINIVKSALDFITAITVLTSACRNLNINMYNARIILSYYYKGKIKDKEVIFILEKFVFLRKHFYIL